MSRPSRVDGTHQNTAHISADGSEMNAGDIPLPVAAAALTSAETIQTWLEQLQAQLNALAGVTHPNPTMTRLGVNQ